MKLERALPDADENTPGHAEDRGAVGGPACTRSGADGVGPGRELSWNDDGGLSETRSSISRMASHQEIVDTGNGALKRTKLFGEGEVLGPRKPRKRSKKSS